MTPDNGRLILKIDCTQDYDSESYIQEGDVKVVDGPAGRYREAEARPLSRFAYKFDVEDLDKPHMAVIRFPDDRRRFMTVNNGTGYDMSSGVVTGWNQPLSGEMQELTLVFWPRSTCSLCFMTWGHDEPAAVESFEIFELDELPVLDIPNDAGDAGRVLGMQYEDPGSPGIDLGAKTFDVWLGRLMEYFKYTGQKRLAYPICWYHGPWYPSDRERSDSFGVVVADDRTMYLPWTDKPADWVDNLLTRFDAEGLEFQGVCTLMRLSSLMKGMNIDLDAIKAGEDTYNNMLWNDHVQEGTMDWTTQYNTLNYPEIVEHGGAAEMQKNGLTPNWAYGEKRGRPYQAGPMFNPLHPTTQEAVLGFFDEIGEKYANHKSFKGVSITLWVPTLVWFGHIRSGYDDYTIGLFEQETGIKVPAETDDPERFSKRYEYLIFTCKEAWIEWRCKKIHELICKIRDTLTKHRGDLELTLDLWSEPVAPLLLGRGEPQQQFGARTNTVGLYKQAGLDIDLFRGEPNIVMDLEIDGGERDRTFSEGEDAAMEHFFMFRDHDFLDQESLDAVHAHDKPAVFVFNAWHEAWGRWVWGPIDPDDQQAADHMSTYCKQAEHVFKMNSEYPEDGFWWDSQLRITHAFPAGDHYMERHAHAVAELDACKITRGGLFLDRSYPQMHQKFAKAYRALPCEKFEDVGESTDPVTVRQLVKDDKRYFYLVNRDYYPVKVRVQFSTETDALYDLATGEIASTKQTWSLVMGPYELKSMTIPTDVDIVGFSAEAPAEIAAATIAEARQAICNIQAVKHSGKMVAGMDKMADRIESAIAEGKLAWLRRALAGYIVCKCAALLKDA